MVYSPASARDESPTHRANALPFWSIDTRPGEEDNDYYSMGRDWANPWQSHWPGGCPGKVPGQDYYFIKWQGWPPSYNTWEPKEHLQCSKLMKEYHQNLKRKKLSRKNKRRKDQHQFSVFMPLVAKPLFPPLTEDTLAKFKQKQSLLLWQEELNRKCTDPVSAGFLPEASVTIELESYLWRMTLRTQERVEGSLYQASGGG
ncbi:hypothetical protein Bbelb_110280 [Branchiostoma belcheri]|nr:hypothetical protein Bbelb_110280 [Branchiostoma belcheri]